MNAQQDTQEVVVPLTEEQVREVIRRAYRLSQPQGMGWLHFEEGDIPEATVDALVGQSHPEWGIEMDYVNGRAVKLTIERNGDSHFIRHRGRWFDHSPEQLRELLAGIE